MIKLLAAFFAFGATMCSLTIVLLLFPGTALDAAWNLNPSAHVNFRSIQPWAVPLMFLVGTACAFAATGLWRERRWGTRLAMTILAINILGDVFNVLALHDYRALIGLPIGGALIFYLARRRAISSA